MALILVFPTSPAYEGHVAGQDSDCNEYDQRGDEEDVIWYRQTINNACGLYAILHAVSNGSSRASICSGSFLEDLLKSIDCKDPAEKAQALEESADLELAYKTFRCDTGSAQLPSASHKFNAYLPLPGHRKTRSPLGILESWKGFHGSSRSRKVIIESSRSVEPQIAAVLILT